MAKTKQPSIHPTVRRVITLVELVIPMILLYFPTMQLVYGTAFKTDVTAAHFVEATAWALPFELLSILCLAAFAAAVLPLFVKQVDALWTMAALSAVAGLSFVSHVALFSVCFFTVGSRTVYGIAPTLVPTVLGVLYVVIGAFSLVEAVCTCRAIAAERRASEEGSCDTDEL